MEAQRTQITKGKSISVGGRRKPLSDCTNTLDAINSSHSSSSSPLGKPQSKSQWKSNSSIALDDLQNCSRGSNRGGPRNRSSASAALVSENCWPRPKSPGVSDGQLLGFETLMSRCYAQFPKSLRRFTGHPCIDNRQTQTARKRKFKTKEIMIPTSSSPRDETRDIGKGLGSTRDGVGISKSGIMPNKKKQHSRPCRQDGTNCSLQDFIQKQQLYFEEIGAFELSEEEVTAGEESE